MRLNGEQHVGKASKHMWTDRLALIGAGDLRHHRALGGRDAEMVRPEPDQALREADLGPGSGACARRRLGKEDLLRDAGTLLGRRRPGICLCVRARPHVGIHVGSGIRPGSGAHLGAWPRRRAA